MEQNGHETAEQMYGGYIKSVDSLIKLLSEDQRFGPDSDAVLNAIKYQEALKDERDAVGDLINAHQRGEDPGVISQLQERWYDTRENTLEAMFNAHNLPEVDGTREAMDAARNNLRETRDAVPGIIERINLERDAEVREEVEVREEFRPPLENDGRDLAESTYSNEIDRLDRTLTFQGEGQNEIADMANALRAERNAAAEMLEAARTGADRETIDRLTNEWKEAQKETDAAYKSIDDHRDPGDPTSGQIIDERLAPMREEIEEDMERFQDRIGMREQSENLVPSHEPPEINVGDDVSSRLNELEVDLANAQGREQMLEGLMEKAVESNNPEMLDRLMEQWEEAHEHTTEIAKEIGQLDPDRAVELLGANRDVAEKTVDPGDMIRGPLRTPKEDVGTIGQIRREPQHKSDSRAPGEELGNINSRAPLRNGEGGVEKVTDIKSKIGQMDEKRAADNLNKMPQAQPQVLKAQPLPGDVL